MKGIKTFLRHTTKSFCVRDPRTMSKGLTGLKMMHTRGREKRESWIPYGCCGDWTPTGCWVSGAQEISKEQNKQNKRLAIQNRQMHQGEFTPNVLNLEHQILKEEKSDSQT